MEFSSFYIATPVLFSAFFLQIISLIFLVSIYFFFRNKDFSNNKIFGGVAGIILLLWQLMFLLFALIFGLGVVGSESKASQFLVMISNFLSADILYILIAPSLKSSKIFNINTAIYLVSTMVRGWMGGGLIAFFIYLCRVGYLKVSIKTIVFYVVVFILIILSSPFLIDLKSIVRTGGDFDFDMNGYNDKLELAVDYILGRFQHLGHTALLINNADEYRRLYELNKILPYWVEGIPQNFFYKLLGNKELLTYSNMMAVRDFGAYSSEAWNANTGLSGWLILLREKSVFLFIYWSLLIIPFFYFIYKYANRQFFNVFSVFMIIYLYHGWFGAFFNLIFLAFIIIFLKKSRFKRVRYEG